MAERPDLTEQQLSDIRGRHARGEDEARIAAQFNVTPRTIEAIVRGKPWRRLAAEEPIGDLFDRQAGKGP
jgi:hypothetical protein